MKNTMNNLKEKSMNFQILEERAKAWIKEGKGTLAAEESSETKKAEKTIFAIKLALSL